MFVSTNHFGSFAPVMNESRVLFVLAGKTAPNRKEIPLSANPEHPKQFDTSVS